MAQGRDEHRMVFDIRGRRRHVVKVVYAILALLMVASLFLVTGAINIGSIFGGNTSGESAASSFEKQAENIEAKLVKSPGDEDLLANLTRTRVNTANAMISGGAGESASGVEEVEHQLALVSEDWSEYQEATSEPSPGLAIQVAPAIFQTAELSKSAGEALEKRRRRRKRRRSSPKGARASTATAPSPSTRSSRSTTKPPKKPKKKRPNSRTPSSNANPSKTSTKKSKKTRKNSKSRLKAEKSPRPEQAAGKEKLESPPSRASAATPGLGGNSADDVSARRRCGGIAPSRDQIGWRSAASARGVASRGGARRRASVELAELARRVEDRSG